MAFLLHNRADPAERQGLVLSTWEAERQRFAWRPAPRLPDLRRRSDR